MIFIIFTIVLGPMSSPELLQNSNLNCTMYWTIIASGLPIFIMIVNCKLFNSTFKTSFGDYIIFKNCIRAHVWPTAFATVQNELNHAVDYHRKRSDKLNKDYMFENVFISLSIRL